MEQTFLLTITGVENGEWQGRIIGKNAEPVEFQSVMKLLILVQKELEELR